jgi:hypothetical protein
MIISQELRLEVASNVDDPAAQYSESSPPNVQGAELWLLQSGTQESKPWCFLDQLIPANGNILLHLDGRAYLAISVYNSSVLLAE